jgi:hypothetical protein
VRFLQRHSDDLLRDYALLRLGDLLSLVFCNEWTEAPTGRVWLRDSPGGPRLLVSPDPLAGRKVAFEVGARALPRQPFRSQGEAERAFAEARTVVLRGVVAGG